MEWWGIEGIYDVAACVHHPIPLMTGLLEMVFMDDEENRSKYNLLIAEGITPKLEASRYMDREENENELKQVITWRLMPSTLVYS